MKRPTLTGSSLLNNAARTRALWMLDDMGEIDASSSVGKSGSFKRISISLPVADGAPGLAGNGASLSVVGAVGMSDVCSSEVPMMGWRWGVTRTGQHSPLQCQLGENGSRPSSVFFRSRMPRIPRHNVPRAPCDVLAIRPQVLPKAYKARHVLHGRVRQRDIARAIEGDPACQNSTRIACDRARCWRSRRTPVIRHSAGGGCSTSGDASVDRCFRVHAMTGSRQSWLAGSTETARSCRVYPPPSRYR